MVPHLGRVFKIKGRSHRFGAFDEFFLVEVVGHGDFVFARCGKLVSVQRVEIKLVVDQVRTNGAVALSFTSIHVRSSNWSIELSLSFLLFLIVNVRRQRAFLVSGSRTSPSGD